MIQLVHILCSEDLHKVFWVRVYLLYCMNKKSDINIEFGHIYQDTLFSKEHDSGVVQFFTQIERIKKDDSIYSTTVMVDDYNVDNTKNFIKDYWNFLEKKGALPQYYVYESSLSVFIDEVFLIFNNRTKKSYQNYINTHKKIPCSLFIVIWYFFRLGIFDENKNNVLNRFNNQNNSPFFAKKIITILPKRFMDVEMIAQKAIQNSKQKNVMNYIETIFF